MRVINIEQGTDEWLRERRGVVTASRFKDIITPAKGELSKSCTAYMYELIAEKLGAETEFFTNDHMERGTELEPQARAVYELMHGVKVEQIGMIKTDCGSIGISPDGLIGDNGGLEIKCPKASTHIKYMLDGVLPLTYKPQVMGSLWISGREYWDFMSFHPQLDPFIIRVFRDEEYIASMDKHIKNFVQEVEKNYRRLTDAG